MNLLNTIKNLFKTIEEPETIKFNQLKNWIINQENKKRTDIVETMEFFEKQIADLISNLEEEKEVLESTNLDDKKAEERIKFIVKQNLSYYITHLERLIKNLKNIEIQEPTILIKNLDEIFIDFTKKSEMNFQKTTILIGKEMQETKNSIDNFFKNIKNHLNENKKLLETSKTISNIKNKLNQLNNFKKTELNINKELEDYNQKRTNLEAKAKENKRIIEEIKKSEEYQKEIIIKQKIIKTKLEQEKEFLNLKKLINFKELANVFHNNPEEMTLIKKFQNNFKETFEKNNHEPLKKLLEITKINSIEIKEKINKIDNTKKEIKDLEDNFKEKVNENILSKESEIKKLKQEIHELDYEITRRKRKFEKLNEDKSKIINQIKSEMNQINVNIEE